MGVAFERAEDSASNTFVARISANRSVEDVSTRGTRIYLKRLGEEDGEEVDEEEEEEEEEDSNTLGKSLVQLTIKPIPLASNHTRS